MTAVLSWVPTTPAMEFTVTEEESGDTVAVSEWSSCGQIRSGNRDQVVEVGSLLRFCEEETAEERSPGVLVVPWCELMQLPEDSLGGLGLPPVADVALDIEGNGPMAASTFKLTYWYVVEFIRKAPSSYERQGALLTGARGVELLPYPIYPLVEKIEACDRESHNFVDIQKLWGEISADLPSDTKVDGALATKRIYVPSTVKPEAIQNENGEPDIGLRLGKFIESDDPMTTGKQFEESLPRNAQQAFLKKWSDVSPKSTYALDRGTVVFIHPKLQRVLTELREIHKGSVKERTDFLHNPDGVLQAKLNPETDEETTVDDVLDLSDYRYGDRVEGIGAWQPKIIPWIKIEGNDWFGASDQDMGVHIPGVGRVGFVGTSIENVIDEMKKAIETGQATVVVDDKPIPATDENLKVLIDLRERTRGKRGDGEQQPPVPEGEQVVLVLDNLGEVNYSFNDRNRRHLTQAAPAGLRNPLLSHQISGLHWLQRHYDAGTPGALLADDMGLGKTLVALAFLKWLREGMLQHGVPRKPILVVGPVGLLQNWQEEHAKHLEQPGLGQLVQAFGRGLRRLRVDSATAGPELRDAVSKVDLDALRTADWVTTSYETLRDYQHSFGKIEWAVAIFDEAQKIKNPGVKVTDAALAVNADFTVIVTGTPVENRVADIWTLLDRAQPARMGSLKEFSTTYEVSAGVDPAVLGELQRKLTKENEQSGPAIMLRRLKHDHLEGLPEKHEYCPKAVMPAAQAAAYTEAIGQGQERNALQALQQIRRVSLHYRTWGGGEASDDYVCASARLDLALKILDEIEQQHEKALIFVETRWMQDFLLDELRRRYSLRSPVLVINGAVKGEDRQRRVNQFQARRGFDAMILSPKAGGVGLTLTAANHVIHLQRWWNPAVEDQCTDRVFRIGQTRPVHVYYPLAEHPVYREKSFDHTLNKLLTRKRDISRTVLAPSGNSKAEIKKLYQEIFESYGLARPPYPAAQIDVMDPLQFERWVAQELDKGGYRYSQCTARSGDGGVDVTAERPSDGKLLLVQCKHSGNIEMPCGEQAVREIVGALGRGHYESYSRDAVELMVVTNAAGFSTPAKRLAEDHGVHLVDRNAIAVQAGQWSKVMSLE